MGPPAIHWNWRPVNSDSGGDLGEAMTDKEVTFPAVPVDNEERR